MFDLLRTSTTLVLLSIGIFSVQNLQGASQTCGLKKGWQPNGSPVCEALNHQDLPQVTNDGSGGAIIAWKDERSAPGLFDIYAQRIDVNGNALWIQDGVVVCSSGSVQAEVQITSDGAGGAIVAWEDDRSGGSEIYAQRLDGDGNTLWTANGVAIGVASYSPARHRVAPDDTGGAILTWEHNIDIFARRVDSGGNPLWGGPVEICRVVNQQMLPKIIADGSGGAFITWEDHRNDPNIEYEIYAQRVDANGNTLWTVNGVEVRNASTGEKNWEPQIAADGAGGVVIAWEDFRGALGIYAQRIDASGNLMWTSGGKPVCTTSLLPLDDTLQIVADGPGGTIIVWNDSRSGNPDIYAQKLEGNGDPSWQINGVALCVEPGDQTGPRLVSDGTGGAIVTWNDERSDNGDIWAQIVDSSGFVVWGTTGSAVCTMTGTQESPKLVQLQPGVAIATWQDGRGVDRDIYAARVNFAPVPDIKVNGQDQNITIIFPTPIQVTVALDPGSQVGQVCEWWIFVDSPYGYYSFKPPRLWRPGLRVSHVGPLFELPDYPIYDGTLPPGDFVFYFAVDPTIDNFPDLTHSDTITVLVQ